METFAVDCHWGNDSVNYWAWLPRGVTVVCYLTLWETRHYN